MNVLRIRYVFDATRIGLLKFVISTSSIFGGCSD